MEMMPGNNAKEMKKMIEDLIINFCEVSPYKAQITSEAIFNLLADGMNGIDFPAKPVDDPVPDSDL